MLTNYFFKDLYNDRWGDPDSPDATEPRPATYKDSGDELGFLNRLRRLFRRRRPDRPSAWSFTIPSERPEAEDDMTVDHRHQCDAMQPKFLNLARALSRNC